MMIDVPEITDLEIAFGSTKVLPKWDDLPVEYQRMETPSANELNRLFALGGSVSHWEPRDGVDKSKALRVVKSHMASWDPKHEHKIGGVAWLIDQWFKSIRPPDGSTTKGGE